MSQLDISYVHAQKFIPNSRKKRKTRSGLTSKITVFGTRKCVCQVSFIIPLLLKIHYMDIFFKFTHVILKFVILLIIQNKYSLLLCCTKNMFCRNDLILTYVVVGPNV